MVKPIRDEKSYYEALKRIESLWGSEIGTPEGDELDVLMILVEAYEDKHYPMPLPIRLPPSSSGWSKWIWGEKILKRLWAQRAG